MGIQKLSRATRGEPMRRSGAPERAVSTSCSARKSAKVWYVLDLGRKYVPNGEIDNDVIPSEAFREA